MLHQTFCIYQPSFTDDSQVSILKMIVVKQMLQDLWPLSNHYFIDFYNVTVLFGLQSKFNYDNTGIPNKDFKYTSD